MGKRLLNSVITVLILLGVFCMLGLLGSKPVEAYTYQRMITINRPVASGIVNGSTYLFDATLTRGSNVTNCSWYYSTDSGTSWTFFNSTWNGTGAGGASCPGAAGAWCNFTNETAFHYNATFDTTAWTDNEDWGYINVTCFNNSEGYNAKNSTLFEAVVTDVHLDEDNPGTKTVTIMDERTIRYVTNSIEIECIGGDPGSSQKVIMKLTKPKGITIEKIVTKTDNWKHVFKHADTNEAGLYYVDCQTRTMYGHNKSGGWYNQQSFRVLYEDVIVEEEVEEKPVAKLDISTKEVYSGVVYGKQGETETFTLDGVTAHTLEFVEVTFTSATLVLESPSVEMTLDVGKYRNADLDGDGVDDVKVTLESIDEDGNAKVEVVNLAKLEEKAREEREAKMPKVEEKPSRAKLWITILVILVVVAVGYYLLKKKKGKKGNVKFSKQDLGL